MSNTQIGVLGSAVTEEVFQLPKGMSLADMDDATVESKLFETTVGGSGACNAMAMSSAGLKTTFMTVLGNGDSLDLAGQEILSKLLEFGVEVDYQVKPGATERSIMILSGVAGKSKAGIRVNGLRQQFEINSNVSDNIQSNKTTIVSAFTPSTILEISELHRESHPDSKRALSWTLNSQSVRAIKGFFGDEISMKLQNALSRGNINMMFVSQHEAEGIKLSSERNGYLAGVRLIVETLGGDGCNLHYRRNGNTFDTIHIPAFRRSDISILNDNGAGEAQHNNFIAVLLNSESCNMFSDWENINPYILNVAGRVGNMAALLKITQPYSAWWPKLDFENIMHMMNDGISPDKIADNAYNQFKFNNF